MTNNQDFKIKLINKAFDFSLSLINYIAASSKNEINKVINNQLLRSGLSIGANISEGQGASSKNDFKNFIHHAYKSSIETRYWLALLDKGSITHDKLYLHKLIEEAKELSKILSSILLTLKGKKTLHS